MRRVELHGNQIARTCVQALGFAITVAVVVAAVVVAVVVVVC